MNGTWGNVCSEYFTPEVGAVACRELGFGGPGFMYLADDAPFGILPLLDGMVCRGTEARLQVWRGSAVRRATLLPGSAGHMPCMLCMLRCCFIECTQR